MGIVITVPTIWLVLPLIALVCLGWFWVCAVVARRFGPKLLDFGLKRAIEHGKLTVEQANHHA